MLKSKKVFIIGLPRTATTSVCLATLKMGFTTAHTAYTRSAFEHAQVLADTPIFADYAELDILYPDAKFVYLTRELKDWIPSIRQLLLRMFTNLMREDGGFNPILKRCYKRVFSPLTLENIHDDNFLALCYARHLAQVKAHFSNRAEALLIINVAEPQSYRSLYDFLAPPRALDVNDGFERINMAGKVTAWKQIKHPLKVESTQGGKVETLHY
ncbi:sulfotransferase [Motilimonas sp. E26]|uniref:sulfotransferase n=1 Tax=Motilimonas sp. E26 TaxID=2865674 RepID=UPI001E56852D|nr:sulfotransferase [Motilimonas sp. E26]MCE0555533.1 sulfotransferase family protein [Motilimonas sp. E26]